MNKFGARVECKPLHKPSAAVRMDKKIENKEEEEFNGVDYIWVPGDDFVDEFLVELQALEESNLTDQTAAETAGEAGKIKRSRE